MFLGFLDGLAVTDLVGAVGSFDDLGTFGGFDDLGAFGGFEEFGPFGGLDEFVAFRVTLRVATAADSGREPSCLE